jgi:CheY-like chemotaxis protein
LHAWEKGLGLGLSICQRIALILDAPLSLRSRIGRGSVFSISVPLSEVGAVPQAPIVTAPARDVAGLRALCVDNDSAILDGMEALLSRWDVSVDRATGLEAALLAVHQSRPDVLLVDFHVQEALDGLAVLDILRREFGETPPPGALLTADGSDELARRARDAGYPLLRKPLRPAALRALIAALVPRRTRGDTTHD